MYKFLSTPPAWGATPRTAQAKQRKTISIHAPRMGSDFAGHIVTDHIKVISIHAPRMGSDAGQRRAHRLRQISIHAPRMGSDRPTAADRQPAGQFLSTPPAWGATSIFFCGAVFTRYFYPRPPHGERQNTTAIFRFLQNISIHAPRMGSDEDMNFIRCWTNYFYPRPPHGERRFDGRLKWN